MLEIDIPEKDIHWQFEWVYQHRPVAEPDTFATFAYIRHKERGAAGRGSVLGCHRVVGNWDRDECRISTLFQALDMLCSRLPGADEQAVRTAVLEGYVRWSRVPKHGTRLGPNQRLLLELLETTTGHRD